ncbi:hypothetical protein KY289_019328 [Solanum tuberosum]|nr:hypothetical protein KY289_019328 [Solanum tuberosum]
MALPNDNIEEKTRQVLSGHAHILNLSLSFINTMSLKCAIQLGIPDIIHSHGRAMTLSDLVNTLSINKSRGQNCVYRLMRILIHAGLFIEEEEGYLLTPNSRLLLKDEPLSLVPLVYSGLDPNSMDPFHYLSQWFQNDDSCTPFASIYGKSLYEYAEKEPILNHLLNEGMASDARLVMSVLIQNGKGLLFEGLKSLVDVGGGTGTVAKAIADAFPQINCTVFELPHVIEGLEGSKNLNFVGGDMFNSIPCADAVLLKWILHNWEDEDCIKILKKCKEAIPNEPMSMIPLLKLDLDPNLMDPWHSLSKWFNNVSDDSNTTPYATAHGMPIFKYAENEPRLNHLFNEAMASDSRLVMTVLIQNGKGLIFEGLKSLMDVGGGTGTVAKAIADAFPQINCTVFELPHVIEGLEGSKNLSFVGGDMFNSIPSANAILLKWILHDWGNENCIKILKKCKEAIPSKENGGKVIIIDMVILDSQKGDYKSYETQIYMDMLTMVVVSGKQKTEQEWAKLFFDAGYSDYNIIPILGLRCLPLIYTTRLGQTK